MPDGSVYGVGADTKELPLANWFAAINTCDEVVTTVAGVPDYRYQSDFEINTEDEPLAVIETLLTAKGKIAEAGGVWNIQMGPPSAPIASITDDVIIATHSREFDMFPALAETKNKLTATYPDPKAAFAETEAVPYSDAAMVQEDGEVRADQLKLGAITNPREIRRVLREALNDGRRYRQHVIALPPAFLGLQVLDCLSWTSVENGYQNKVFEVTGKQVEKSTLNVILNIREKDPADYSYNIPADSVAPVYPSTRPTVPQFTGVPGLVAYPVTENDADGNPRKPAIMIAWNDQVNATSIEWQVRVAATGQVVGNGLAPAKAGSVRYRNVLSNTLHQVRARMVRNSRKIEWSDWIDVLSPTVNVLDEIENPLEIFQRADLYPIQYVEVLPVEGDFDGQLVFVGPENQLYRWIAAESRWSNVIDDAIEGTLDETAFARSVSIPSVVDELPQTGSAGEYVTLTTDGKLYEWNADKGEFVQIAAVEDITFGNLQGEISVEQIPNGLISADKIADDLNQIILEQGQSASADKEAAEQAATLAEQARDAAITARNQSQTHRNASEAAKNASEQARDAAQVHATNASGSATAAAGSASLASTKSDEAGDHAQAAAASVVEASAAYSSTLSAIMGTSIIPRFVDSKLWSGTAVGFPDQMADAPAGWFVVENGERIFSRQFSSSIGLVYSKTLLPGGDKAYRIRMRYRIANPVDAQIGISIAGIRADGTVANWMVPSAGLGPVHNEEQADIQEITIVVSAFVGGGAWVHGGILNNPHLRVYPRSNAGSGTAKIYSIDVEDVTAEFKALISANASATSASSAAASASDASQEAAASQTAKSLAETARAGSEAARDESVIASQTATDAASTAITQAGIATGAANAAGQSGDAAAQSETVATSKASEASISASAAQTHALSANTARTQAQTARNEAVSAKDDAEGAASAASQQAGLATTAKNDAQGFANASANSATQAATSANTATQQAMLAQTHRLAANTSAGQAQTAATNAATSETNAAGSASAAASSATISTAAYSGVLSSIMGASIVPTSFVDNKQWSGNAAGFPDQLADAPLSWFAEINGEKVAVRTFSTNAGLLYHKAFVPGGDKAYRIKLRYSVTEATGGQIAIGVACIRSDATVANWLAPSNGVGSIHDGPTSETQEINCIVSAFNAPDVWQSNGVLNNPHLRVYPRSVAGSGNFVFHSLQIEDVTNSLKALISATASHVSAQSAEASANSSASHASAASGYAATANTARAQTLTYRNEAQSARDSANTSAASANTNAGIVLQAVSDANTYRTQAQGFASAAQTSANNAAVSANTAVQSANTASSHSQTAQTQAGIATTKAGEAASSASAANTSAVDASSYATLASLALSNGMAVNPTFLNWTGTYPAQMSVTLGSNGSVHKDPGKYGNAIRIVTTTGGVGPYITLTNSDTLSQLNGNRNPDKVMVSLEAACSGNLNGFTVDAGWYDGSTWYNSGQLVGPKLKAGAGVQSYQFTLSRPAGAEGKNITAFRLRFLPSHNQYGASYSACTVRLHRIDCSEVVADSFVDQQISTKATVDGIASAGYIMRVKAGGAGAGFEMVAANNPTGPASSIRMNADEIILNGSVKAPQIGAGAVGAEQIAANSIAGRHMIVADLVNLVPDSDFVDAPSWNRDESPGWIFQIAGPVFSGINWAKAPATQRGSVWSQQFSVEQGSEYYFSIEARRDGAGGDATLGARINWLNGTGESIDFTPNIVGTLTGSYQKFSGSFVAPANAKRARIHFFCSNGSVGSVCVGAPTVRLKYGGKLIVDGDIEGRHIKSDSLESGLLNTTSMSNAGLAVFGGTLQSDNFNIANNTGWRIQKNGTANFNNLIVRNSLQVGSVSDIVQNYTAGEERWAGTSESQQRIVSLGAMEPTDSWHVNISVMMRGCYGNWPEIMGGEPTHVVGYKYTRIKFYRRTQVNGTWESWEEITWSQEFENNWRRLYHSETIGGEFQNVQYRITSEVRNNGNSIGTYTQTNIRKPMITARQVTR